MKKIVLFIGCIFFTCIVLNAQVRVAMPINPSSPLDTYPTHIDTLGHGGFMAVRTKAIRNSIPQLRRKEGMLVYVLETDSLYQLRGDVAQNNWVQFKLMASAVNTINTGTSGNDVNSAISPDGNTLTLNIPDASPTARGVVTTATQTFGGPKTFSNGLTIAERDAVNAYKSKLILGINSTQKGPNLSSGSNRNSKFLAVDENGNVILAPGVPNRYVTLQKVVDLKKIWDQSNTSYDDPINISASTYRYLFVDFSNDLSTQLGLSFWGAALAINISEYGTLSPMRHQTILARPYVHDIFWEIGMPGLYVELYNYGGSPVTIWSYQKILITLTIDLLDPYLDGPVLLPPDDF